MAPDVCRDTEMVTRLLSIVFFLALVTVMDVVVSPRLSLGFAQPSLTITFILILAVFSSPEASALLGCMAGIMVGGLANEHMSAHVVSLTLSAYGVSRFFPLLSVARTRGVTSLMVLLGSLGASILFLLLVPERHILLWLRDTIGNAGYNTVLAYLFCPLGRWMTRMGSKR